MAWLQGPLIWALSVQLAETCLCCWPDADKYFSYDVELLVGGNREYAARLQSLFLGHSGKCAIYGGRFMEWEDMQRETGILFLQLREVIKKDIKDPERFMGEAGREKQNYSTRLEEASGIFVKEICSASCEQIRFRPYEVVDCGSCRLLKAPCKEALVCAGPNIPAAVLVPLVILLGAGTGMWYYRRKKAGEGGESKAQEGDSMESSSESSGSSEWSDETDDQSAPQPTKALDLPYQNVPSTPYQNVPPAPGSPYQNVPPAPGTPYQNVSPIPSPPNIWSP